ncbi:hypothetical protein QQ045_004164 [Rhodiola kirilowii]
MFSNWGQHVGSPSLQGMSQLASAHDHISASDTKVNQQYDKSSYDSSMANAGCNLNGIYLQGIPSQHGPLFNCNQIQQQNAQSSGFTRSFLGEQNLDSSNQAFVSLQDCPKSNVYGHVQSVTRTLLETLNRQAFLQRMQQLMRSTETDKVAALVIIKITN